MTREVVRDLGGSPRRSVSKYNAAVILVAAIGSIIYGYNSSVISTSTGQPSFYRYFNLSNNPSDSGYSFTTGIIGACNGLAQAGGFFGSFLNAWVADHWGRRACFRVASIICLIGGALQGGAPNLTVFLLFRFVSGLGVGMCLTATPLYQSEMAPAYARGLLVGSHGAFLAIGYNIASWIGLGSFFSSNSSFQWRFPLAFQCFFPLFLLMGSFWIPHSPRWLVSKDRIEEAKVILERLYASPDDPENTQAQKELSHIVAQIGLERNKYLETYNKPPNFLTDFRYLLGHSQHRRRALLGFGIMFGAQCTGVLVINNYQVVLFPGLGISAALSLGLYSVYLAIALVGNSICGTLVDHFGRRRCILTGLVGCLTALIGECIFAHYASLPGASRAILSTAVFFIFWYIPFFSSLIDPAMYIYASEIFPAEVRSIGIAVSMSGQWLATIIFLQSAPTAFDKIGYRFYIVFIICTVLLFPIVYYFYPETNGISLEDMARVFGEEVATDLKGNVEHLEDAVDKNLVSKEAVSSNDVVDYA